MSHFSPVGLVALVCLALAMPAAASAAPDAFQLWKDGAFRGANVMVKRSTVEDLSVLRSWGANLAEIPVSNVYDANPPYAFQPENLQRLDTAVAAAEQAGLYVALTCREGPGRANFETSQEIWKEPAAQEAYAQMWRKVAEHFRGRAAVVGYDLMCEPHPNGTVPQADWNGLAKRITAAIREVDKSTPIIVNPTGWGFPQGFTKLEPTGDPRTVYCVHVYEPKQYTHQQAGDKRVYPGFHNDWEPEVKWNKDTIAARLAPVVSFEKKYHVPIFVGEFGCARYAPGADQYLRDQMDTYEQHHWSWAYWAFREWQVMNIERTADPEDEVNHADTPLLRLFKGYFAKNTVFLK